MICKHGESDSRTTKWTFDSYEDAILAVILTEVAVAMPLLIVLTAMYIVRLYTVGA